jgi:hypothetical protein
MRCVATYDSYLLWSTMTLEDQRITVGVLGRVRVDVDKVLKPKPKD